MNTTRLSKRLSWLLRHGAHETGLPMDAAGWASIHDVQRVLAIGLRAIERCVAENNKRRLQLEGDRIRATQGHSFSGTPVTHEALEASWVRVDDRVAPLVHGTSAAKAPEIARSGGLRPMNRTHVHLAGSGTARVGKRAGVALHLLIDPERLRASGHELFVSPNGVFLAREVPWHCVCDIEWQRRRSPEEEAGLRARLVPAANSD